MRTRINLRKWKVFLISLVSLEDLVQILLPLGDKNEDGTSMEENTGFISTAPSLHGSAIDDPPSDSEVQMPAEWASPWSNALLNQRIREQVTKTTDSAARFIADNALNDLARFTFGIGTPMLEFPAEYSRAFYVIDYDQNQQLVLDTSIRDHQVLQKLMKQVFRSPITFCIG